MKYSWLFSAWQRLFVAGALLMALLLSVPVKVNALSAGTLVALTNTQRAAVGVGPLSYNGALTSSASAKAHDMLAKGYWAHTSPDGLSAWSFVSNAGYPYVTVGENLARDFGSDAGVISGWLASPGHRANMLNPAFRDVGIAVASGVLAGQQTTIVVAHYGATASAPAPAPAPAPNPASAPAPKPATAPRAVAAVASTAQESVQPAVVEQAPTPAVKAVQAVAAQPKVKNAFDTLIENLAKIIEPTESNLTSFQ